jgi:hypothetical protein
MTKPPEVPNSGPDRREVIETIREATNDIEFGPAFMTDLLLFVRENARDLFSGQTTFFILGSYEEYPMRRLQFVERELNSRRMTYAFVLCDLPDPDELTRYRARDEAESGTDDRDDGNDEGAGRADEGEARTGEGGDEPMAHCQFYLLATYSDYLVPVFEGRHAGPSVELGEIRNNFFEDTHVFTREYAPIDRADGPPSDADGEESNLGAGDRVGPDVDLTNPYSRPQEDLFALFDSEGRRYRWTYRADLALEVQKLPSV